MLTSDDSPVFPVDWVCDGRTAGVPGRTDGTANGFESVTFIFMFYHFQKAYRRKIRGIPEFFRTGVPALPKFLAKFSRNMPYLAEECF
jgi:hypothetical protein